MRSVCLCASACPVCVPAPPGVFLPVNRHRGEPGHTCGTGTRAENPDPAPHLTAIFARSTFTNHLRSHFTCVNTRKWRRIHSPTCLVRRSRTRRIRLLSPWWSPPLRRHSTRPAIARRRPACSRAITGSLSRPQRPKAVQTTWPWSSTCSMKAPRRRRIRRPMTNSTTSRSRFRSARRPPTRQAPRMSLMMSLTRSSSPAPCRRPPHPRWARHRHRRPSLPRRSRPIGWRSSRRRSRPRSRPRRRRRCSRRSVWRSSRRSVRKRRRARRRSARPPSRRSTKLPPTRDRAPRLRRLWRSRWPPRARRGAG